MAKFLIMLLAGAVLNPQTVDPVAQKSAEAACVASYKSPIKVTASQNTQSLRATGSQTPGACEHEISTKGTGAAGKSKPHGTVRETVCGAGAVAADQAQVCRPIVSDE